MKTAKKTVFNLANQLQKILNDKPPAAQMLKDVEMMKFKIRPVVGDISILNFKNTQLIEALWGLGKLDEFFRSHFKDISAKEKETFFQMVNQLRGKLENQLSKISIRQPVSAPQMIELEIFKEYPRRSN